MVQHSLLTVYVLTIFFNPEHTLYHANSESTNNSIPKHLHKINHQKQQRQQGDSKSCSLQKSQERSQMTSGEEVL